jgi:AraC-like DNA-binding protein
MVFYTIPPPLSLADYVRFFWVLESDKPYTHRNMADGGAEIVFHYKGLFNELHPDGTITPSGISGIQGPLLHVKRFSIDQAFGIFGVYLYPFAIPQLFSVPAPELVNQLPDMASFLGRQGATLEEEIMLAGNNNERVSILSRFLLQQLQKKNKPPAFINQAISTIIQNNGNIKISDLSSQYYLSTRQFERKFKEMAGLSPKLYTRIIRFQAATRAYKKKYTSLTELAYSCGYYDQSHFINDFKLFSGLHPKTYFSGITEATEWRNE